MSWITDLDACASAGIIAFDAPAFVTGTKPRYYGNPPFATIPGELNPISYQPKNDEFKKKGDPAFKNPTWKKLLFTGLAITGLVLGFRKIPRLRNLVSSINFASLKTLPSKAWQGMKNLWGKVVNVFKRTP